jgi:hypothetical protein
VLINETQNISNSTLRGTSDFGAQPSFAWKGDPQVVCGTANPCLYSTNTAYLFDLTLSNNSANGANMVVFDLTSNIPGPTLDNINFSLSNGTDYSNMALLFRGTHTASGCCSTFNNVLFSSTQNGNLTSTFPAFYVDNGGDIKFTNLFFSGKGMLLRPTVSASYIDADVIYSQGNYMPYFTLSNQLGGGTASVAVRAATCIFDTTFQPLIANLGGLAVGLDEQLCTNTAGNSAVVTGVPTISTNEGLSQNLAARFTSSPTTFDGAYYNNVTVGPGTVPQMLYDNSVNVGPAFSSFVQDAVPAAPTCATASAGPPYTPVGTWTFKFDWIYANSGVGNLSPASASCTANGTSQQITITLPSTPQAAGAPGAFIYASTNTGAGPWATMGSTQPTTTTQTHVYTETFTVYAAPTGAGSGPVGMGPSGLLWGKNIASNSGTPCNPAYFDLTDYIISTPTAYEGACYSGATPDVQMNACNTAMLASTTTNSTCDLRNFGGQQSGAGIFLQNEVDFGNNSGFGGAIIAPDSCRWFVSTNSTSAYGIRLYKGMSLVNNAPGSSGNCGVQAAAGSVFNYLFGTDTSQPANSYGLIRGFAVKNFVTVPNSGVTAIIQGYFDNFMAENFFVSCGGYTIASGTNTCLEVTGVSSAATFLNLQVNGNQGAGIIPFQDIATGTTSRAAGDGQTFINFNCTHPGVNLNCAQFIDTAAPSGYRTATNIMSGYYESHNGASTAAHFYVNNWGSFSLNHSVFNLQSASFTAPLLEVTYSTQITHVSFCDITVNGGSGVTPTFPYLIYQNDVTGQKVYTDQTGHYSKCYSNSTEAQGVNPIAYSTTPAMDVSLGSIQQFACTTAGAAIVPTIANLQAGIEFTVIFVQNGTTACTWTWPSTIHGATAVSATLNSVSVQKLIVSNNGTDAYAESATVGTTGGTP